MSESDESDILADIKALDNALVLDINDKADSSWHDLHDESSSSTDVSDNESFSESEIYNQSCQNTEDIDAYEINKKLIKSLTLLKKKVNILLQRCEEKIEELNEEIETNKDGGVLNERARYSIVGMPYFKDKLGFGPIKNAETMQKESRGELSILHIQRSCRWSGKDRTTLLSTICDEVFNSISVSGLNMEVEQPSDKETDKTEDETTNSGPSKSSSTTNISAKRTVVIPINFNEMVKTIGEKQIDWFKIATQNFENKHSPIECRSMWNVYLHPDINKGDWTTNEDRKLVQYAKQCGYQDWNTIAEKLDTKRSAYQCFIRYNTIRSVSTGRAWTKQEDTHLQLVIKKLQIGNYIPWSEVAIYMSNRTKQQVYTRWIYRVAPYLIKGRFNHIETQTLLEAVKRYGTDFGQISRLVMPHRTTVQLNAHYQSLLQTNANIWTRDDDIKLLKLHKKCGNDWVKIAKHFSRKTRTQVRHRHLALRKYATKYQKVTPIFGPNQLTSVSGKTIGGSSAKKSKFRKVSLINCNISNDKIQARLFENLNFPLTTESTGSQEVYDVKELADTTKELYDTLRLLGTNFDVPNMFFDYAHLSKKERQLFTSLKKYVQTHHYVDDEKRDEIIEKFRFQMFGPETNATSHFIPPPPTNGHMKRKRQRIDSDYKQKFLVDVATDRIIPFSDNSIFIDVDEDIQFQKLSQLLINNNYSCNRQNVNSYASLDNSSSLNESRTRRLKANTGIAEKSAIKAIQSCETQETTCSEYINKDRKEINILGDAIAPSQETLLGLKNLFFWKMLYEYETNQSYPISKNSTQQHTEVSKSPEYEKAYQTLKTRLIRLFKLPLALSRVMVELPEHEALFVMEEQKEQSTRKRSETETELSLKLKNKLTNKLKRKK